MSRTTLPALALALAVAAACPTPHAQAGQLGADVNADVDAFGHSQMDTAGLRAFARKNTVYPLPAFRLTAGDHARYWDRMVEQYGAAQLDFVAVWLKGNGQPATFANLVTALDRHGLAGRVKVMPFDDNPASWTALWNFDHGDGYGYKTPFDLSRPECRAFVWDNNLKAFFQSVPDANRYKIRGRPVYALWSGSPAFLSHLDGNGSKLLAYLRRQCQDTFGFNPYILVPEDWVKNDPSSDSPGVVDAVYPWFTPVPGPAYAPWRTHTWNGVTLGVCVPQFRIANDADPNAKAWIVDPRHGKTLADGLRATAGGRCAATFIEGFDDYWENTALWRTRTADEAGHALGYTQTGYDYPNQRLNLVRRYSNNPFPLLLTEAAAGADSSSGAVAPEDTDDAVYGAQAGASLGWRDVPLEGVVRLQVRASTAASGARMHFVIDGVRSPSVAVPDTGGGRKWATVDMGTRRFPYASVHAVALVWDAGGIAVRAWRAQTTQLPAGLFTVVAHGGGVPLGGDGAAWRVRPLAPGRYAVGRSDGAAAETWRLALQPDGFCTLRATPARTDLLPQEWSLAPAR